MEGERLTAKYPFRMDIDDKTVFEDYVRKTHQTLSGFLRLAAHYCIEKRPGLLFEEIDRNRKDRRKRKTADERIYFTHILSMTEEEKEKFTVFATECGVKLVVFLQSAANCYIKIHD